MRRLFQQILPVVLALSLPMEILAQTQANQPYIPSVLPPGPDAAALMKFTDVPVSPYTGTASVTVPIYTVQAKGISVPISLAYHTGGIRVKEESSVVGLGWALDAGGSISRTIMDQDDFGTMGYSYFTTMVPQPNGDMAIPQPYPASGTTMIAPNFYDMYCTYLVSTTTGNSDYYNAFGSGGQTYDMEPDIFTYNFPGHSGKFILTRAGKAVLQKQDNIVIQFQGTLSSVTFTITDDQGNKYFFNTTETTQSVGAATPISTWLISKIITQQQDSILFNYTAGTSNKVEADINEVVNSYCSLSNMNTTVQNSPTIYNTQLLQNIVFSNGQLNFYFDATRSDLYNGNKLDSVLLYSKNASGTLTYIKQHNCYYSYFNSSYIGNVDSFEFMRLRLDSVKEKSASGTLPAYAAVYNNPNPGALSAKHGFSVDHWGYFNAEPNSTFIPTMNTIYAPPMEPTAVSQYYNYPGANRTPDPVNMQTFSLQKFTYPTGGSTVFAYQPNDYDFKNSNGGNGFADATVVPVDTTVFSYVHGTKGGNINLTYVFPSNQQQVQNPTPNLNISVTFRYLVNNDSIYKNTTHKIYFQFTYQGNTVTADINSATGSPNSPAFSVSVPITFLTDPGVCSWSIYIDPSIDTVNTFADVHANFQYHETQQDYDLLENNTTIAAASGLRIQSVTNYKDASTIASEKVYSYTYSQDKTGSGTPQIYTYGRLMDFPTYARYNSTPDGNGGHCWGLSLFSSSYSALTSAITGNIVGYDQVTETSVDPLSGNDIGKTVYSYFNASDTPWAYCEGAGHPGALNMGNNLNGTLLSKIEYADYGGIYTPITQTNYYYHTTNRSVYWSPKYSFVYITHINSYMNPAFCTVDSTVVYEINATFYPSLKSERVLLDSTVNIVFAQQNPASFATVRNANYYDNPLHYQVTRAYTYDSKGDTLVMKLKYPQDYIPSGQQQTYNTILDSMIGRNIVSETIEKQDSFYYPGSSAGYITGAQLSLYRINSPFNAIVPDRTYKLAINSPITNFQPFAISGNTTSLDSRYRQMVSFDQYDAYNNLQQYTPVDQNSVTFVWDYSHVYPIAQAKNAALGDVAATSFEADGTGNWTYTGAPTADTTCITGNYSYNLGGGNITKSGLTSGMTYVLSYWTKNSSSLSIAGTIAGYPIKGKTIRGWTYYEHKLTGQASLTISGTGYIDELRLYPATAQMTTYTYSPLVGQTTACDVDNKVTYYFYDAYQRLKRIKDQDGNIIKTFQYHYANQNPFNQ